jgi:Lon protease-like protein
MEIPAIPESAAVFPLPDTVLFPRASVSLHVFEPCYREMTRYALERGGVLCTALLLPGWEAQSTRSAPIYDVGCAGVIRDLRETEDGRFYFTLSAIGRVRFRRFLQEEPFRVAQLLPLEERIVEEDEASRRETLEMLASYAAVLQLLNPTVSDSVALSTELPLPDAVDQVLMRLDFDAHTKQRLLEDAEPVLRCRWVTRLLGALLRNLRRVEEGGEGTC